MRYRFWNGQRADTTFCVAELPVLVHSSFLRRCDQRLVLHSKVDLAMTIMPCKYQREKADEDNSSTTTYGLFNGGSGGLIIMFLVNFIGLFFVVISLAEMSAM